MTDLVFPFDVYSTVQIEQFANQYMSMLGFSYISVMMSDYKQLLRSRPPYYLIVLMNMLMKASITSTNIDVMVLAGHLVIRKALTDEQYYAWVLYVRDKRHGLGLRNAAVTMLMPEVDMLFSIECDHPKHEDRLERFRKCLLAMFNKFGCWKDLRDLMLRTHMSSSEISSVSRRRFWQFIVHRIVVPQYHEDMKACHSGERPSMMAKWLPREHMKHEFGMMARKLAVELHPRIQHSQDAWRQYRRNLSFITHEHLPLTISPFRATSHLRRSVFPRGLIPVFLTNHPLKRCVMQLVCESEEPIYYYHRKNQNFASWNKNGSKGKGKDWLCLQGEVTSYGGHLTDIRLFLTWANNHQGAKNEEEEGKPPRNWLVITDCHMAIQDETINDFFAVWNIGNDGLSYVQQTGASKYYLVGSEVRLFHKLFASAETFDVFHANLRQRNRIHDMIEEIFEDYTHQSC
jgi:hypothetical protein